MPFNVRQNPNKFLEFIKNYNIIGFTLGVLVANQTVDLANAIIDGMIMPTIQPILDKLGKKGVTLKVGGIIIHLEKVIPASIKFCSLAVVIFILMSLGVRVTKPVSWVRVVGNDASANLS